MPHTSRRKSESGYYHVVPKGIGDQLIFEGDGDRRLYLNLLREAKDVCGIRIHAYCLMSNHAHLVLEDPKDELSAFMKHVDERYGMFFAGRSGRTGGVLRRPFWSEPIETDEYLMCAVRYVHANPASAGLCAASAYEWSSVRDYLGKRDDDLTTCETVLDMLGGKEGFIEFSKASNSTARPFPGSKLIGHLSDDEAQNIAKMVLGEDKTNLAVEAVPIRRAVVEKLASRSFTVRQIARITGLGKNTVQSYLSK